MSLSFGLLLLYLESLMALSYFPFFLYCFGAGMSYRLDFFMQVLYIVYYYTRGGVALRLRYTAPIYVMEPVKTWLRITDGQRNFLMVYGYIVYSCILRAVFQYFCEINYSAI